jgi:hypothetical protein
MTHPGDLAGTGRKSTKNIFEAYRRFPGRQHRTCGCALSQAVLEHLPGGQSMLKFTSFLVLVEEFQKIRALQ